MQIGFKREVQCEEEEKNRWTGGLWKMKGEANIRLPNLKRKPSES